MKINGMPVIDARRRLTITITPADVRKGGNKNPSSCAAAQALLRNPKCTAARVHIARTYVQVGKKWLRYHTPRALRSEIISFDRGAVFDPGDYTLVPLQPSHRDDARRVRKEPKKSKNPITRTKPHYVKGVRQHGANR